MIRKGKLITEMEDLVPLLVSDVLDDLNIRNYSSLKIDGCYDSICFDREEDAISAYELIEQREKTLDDIYALYKLEQGKTNCDEDDEGDGNDEDDKPIYWVYNTIDAYYVHRLDTKFPDFNKPVMFFDSFRKAKRAVGR